MDQRKQQARELINKLADEIYAAEQISPGDLRIAAARRHLAKAQTALAVDDHDATRAEGQSGFQALSGLKPPRPAPKSKPPARGPLGLDQE